MQMSAADLIDSRPLDFLSYGPPLGEQRRLEEIRVPVEPEAVERSVADIGLVYARFPLRPSKVQRPCLSDETLPRQRLFDWFDARRSHRVFYVTAEAGFGKTTLVADYLRRSGSRIFWYRLDEDETDGLVFMRYLVAACQMVDGELMKRASALLTEPSLTPINPERVLETLLSEMGCLGDIPSALVLDDFHVAERLPEIGSIVERLIARSPAGLKFVLASRRTPGLSVAALRARGELGELGREDLRFDEAETGRLFRDAYHHPLEPDVLHDLQTRTDGWAASLQLIKTAVEGRSPSKVRAFVKSLSGAEGDLHDYLAEEVIGELRPDLRDFLLRTAILEDVEPETAAVTCNVTPGEARCLLAEAQSLGLMSKVGDGRTWRSHPLVQEFLLAHLEAEVGQAGVAQMHRQLAQVMEATNWRLSARHWAAAGMPAEVRRVVAAATLTIIGTGDLSAADEFIALHPDPDPNPWFEILRTRRLAADGRYTDAAEAASHAEELGAGLAAADASFADACALNRLHLGLVLGDPVMHKGAAKDLAASDDRELASIARSSELLTAGANGGSLDALCSALDQTARLSRSKGHFRHEAVSLINMSMAELARDNWEVSVRRALDALALVAPTHDSADIAAANICAAKALARGGRWSEAQSHVEVVLAGDQKWIDPEAIAEAAEIHAMYGDPQEGRRILERSLAFHQDFADGSYWRQVAARVALQLDGPEEAAQLIADVQGHNMASGFDSATRSLRLQIRAARASVDSTLTKDIADGVSLAEKQQARLWWKNIRMTQALVSSAENLASHIRGLDKGDRCFLSIQAELVASRLDDLDDSSFAVVRAEASLRPERWRRPARRAIIEFSASPLGAKRAVELVEMIGETEDVARLRAIAKHRALRLPNAGRPLIRRLAPRVYVEDLGRVSVQVGRRVVSGPDIRKKVLSLLCFLLTRPQFTATREQVFEALWPEMGPDAGANSLNQSTYFLRRVIEPNCVEDESAGYLQTKADLLWLDEELVGCRSSDCLRLIAAIRRDPSPGSITRLAETYKGRYAVDFIYDDWASSFREALHASYLDRLERAIIHDTKAGAFDRALALAQLALQADPDADQIELYLLRLYRRMGANAAAAEQYAHYVTVMREQLGVEPPPLESL